MTASGTKRVAFSPGQLVAEFRGRRLPVEAYLAGYSAIIDVFDLAVPLHHEMFAVAPRNMRLKQAGWSIFRGSMRPAHDVISHLVFALKYEGLQLLTLKSAFAVIDAFDLETAARVTPTSAYVRRLCFLYEWLTGRRLHILDVTAGTYVDAIDTDLQYAAKASINSKRFRVRNNLPGSASFCPLVHRTREIDRLIDLDLGGQARSIVQGASKELISRAAAFLLLSDSRASFAIEGETPPRDRIARWRYTIGKAGQVALSVDELVKLQKELIGDARFVVTGLRREGGFVDRHDVFGMPAPEHVSAAPGDLAGLLGGLVTFEQDARVLDYDPVLTAASIAFGFVYILPFEDGNGRIHRFLMHHVLADRRYTPEEIVFPISNVILDDLVRYKDVLERTSSALLPFIPWRPTARGDVEITGETVDYYRFFDATAHAEFLLRCIERAVNEVLPEELAFLRYRDDFHRQATEIVDMPSKTIDMLLGFLRQNRGRLSKRAREREFKALTEAEVARVEALFAALST